MDNRTELEQFIFRFAIDEKLAYPPVMEDLYSLYKIIRESRIVSVLEFGCGWSTLVITKALKENYELYNEEVSQTIRHPNPFQVMSVDTSEHFIDVARKRIPSTWSQFVHFQQSACKMTTIRDQICSLYDDIPPWTADLIYIDGPDCDHVIGSVNGFHLDFGDESKKYGLPMGADCILLEPFFWPGTRILTDGRGANAYFLKSNFRRNWDYYYDEPLDQHSFYLNELPWGGISEKLMQFKSQGHFSSSSPS